MNGKKAKALRRIAREMTMGHPNVVYHDKQHLMVHNGKKYQSSQRVLADCTRKVYKLFKKKYKAGQL